jgi:hypothetical protein
MVLFPLIADSPLQSVYKNAQFVGFPFSLAQWSNLVPAAHAKHVLAFGRVVFRPFEIPAVHVIPSVYLPLPAKHST